MGDEGSAGECCLPGLETAAVVEEGSTGEDWTEVKRAEAEGVVPLEPLLALPDRT